MVGAVPIRVQISGDASKYSIPPPAAKDIKISRIRERRAGLSKRELRTLRKTQHSHFISSPLTGYKLVLVVLVVAIF